MANKFVWSGATGSADGSSWDNAYTSLMRDWGAEGSFTPATDYIYVRSVHSESAAADKIITGGDGEGTIARVRVICVVGDTTGTTPGALATGAAIATTSTGSIKIYEAIYIYGVNFSSNHHLFIGYLSSNDADISLDNCNLSLVGAQADDQFTVTSGSGLIGTRIRIANCIIGFSNVNQGMYVNYGSIFIYGGSVSYGVNTLITQVVGGSRMRVTGTDLSVLTSKVLVSGNTNVYQESLYVFSRCLLGSGTVLANQNIDVPGFCVESYLCQIGTDADPSYQMEIQDARGKVSADTAHYRTGGASDGVRATPISWNVDTTVGSVRGYPGHAFECPPITAWTDGDGSTAHTYRIAFASDASIKDDELWIELEGPNDAATNSLAALKTTRVAPQTTAAAYTTDGTSTWNGTGVTTAQYMEVSYTPDKPGPVTVRVMMAKASDNIYVDPKIQIDP